MTHVEDEKTLRLLEERISQLEGKVLGSYPPDDNYPEVIDTLASLGSKLGNALSTRDRMMMVMKRSDELERYMDPSYGNNWEVTDTMKAEILLSQDDQIRKIHEQLDMLQTKKKVLDSEPIANTANLTNDLITINKRNDEINEKANIQSQEIIQLLDKYNSIICTLTETLVKMDDVVSKAEQKANKKTPIKD